jgi:hypothetical protein
MKPGIAVKEATDRRRRPRLRLAYPLCIRIPGESICVETKTEDLSCEGFSFISERSFSPHQVLECELVIPGNLVLRGRAQVVRVVTNRNGGTFGLACRFEDYAIYGSQSDEFMDSEP